MKYLIILFLFISSTVKAQSYEDSTITIQAPRAFAWYVTKSIKSQLNEGNFRMIDALQGFVSNSTKPDSLFTVKLKAKFVREGIELLISRQAMMVVSDYLKIIYNQKVAATGAAIVGYTGLAAQINSKANGSSSEKETAVWLRSWFNERKAAMENLYKEERDGVIRLVNQ